MSHSRNIHEINSVITSLLVARKISTKIQVVKLDREYYDEIGERIPYLKLGYSSLSDYLRTVPGIEVINVPGLGTCVNFLGTEKTKHVTELVSRQRSKYNKGRTTGYKRQQSNLPSSLPTQSPRPVYCAPLQPVYPYHMAPCSIMPATSTIPLYASPQCFQPPKFQIDNLVLCEITHLLKNYPSGMYKQDLLYRLQDIYGRNSRMINLTEYLKALGNSVIEIEQKLYDRGTYERQKNKTMINHHSDSASASINSKKYDKRNNNYNGLDDSKVIKYDKHDSRDVGIDDKKYDNKSNGIDNNNNQDIKDNSVHINANNSAGSSVNDNNIKCANNNDDYVEDYAFDDLDYNISETIKISKLQGNNQDNGDAIEEVRVADCENHCNDANTGEQNTHYDNELTEIDETYPVTLDINTTYDMNGNSENLTGVQDNNITTNNNDRDYLFSQNQEYVSNVLNKRTQFRLEKLIQCYPDGIWCADLPALYEETYKFPLSWEELGFQRLSDFAAHLPDIFHIIAPYPNGDVKLYDAKNPVPDENAQVVTQPKATLASIYNVYNDDDDDEPVPTSVSPTLSVRLCPDDVITIQERIGQVSVTEFGIDDKESGEKIPMIEVEVVEAFSPSFFWIHLLKKKRKFNEMMSNLAEFYDDHKDKYKVPVIMLERGLNIACRFYGQWHRGIIKAVDPNCKVTVLFYDYGTLSTYASSEIFYLNRQFTILPAQAIPCGLYGIAPVDGGNEWSKHVRDKFITWVFKRPLWATIVKTDVDKNSMLVILTDTTGDDDFVISDYLFSRDMAKIGNMGPVNPNDLNLYIEDYGEYCMKDSDDNQVFPTTLRPKTCSVVPNVDDVDKNLPSEETLKEFKKLLSKKLDEYMLLVLNLHEGLLNSNAKPLAHSLLKITIYEPLINSILKIIFPSLNFDTSNQQTLLNGNLSSSLRSLKCNLNDIMSQMEDDNFTETIHFYDTIGDNSESSTTPSCTSILERIISDTNCNLSSEIGENFARQTIVNDYQPSSSSSLNKPRTNGDKLSISIKEQAQKFFQRTSECTNAISNRQSNPFVQKLNTNPFTDDLTSDTEIPETKGVKQGPPLPPRPNLAPLLAKIDNKAACESESSVYNKIPNDSATQKFVMDSASTSDENILFLAIGLTAETIHIFYFDDEVWIILDEFRSALTFIENNDNILKTVARAKVQLPFRKIGKEKYPFIVNTFNNVIKHKLVSSRGQDYQKPIDTLMMIPIMSILKLMYTLKIITAENIKEMHNTSGTYVPPAVMIDVKKLIDNALYFRAQIIHKQTNY